MNSNKEHKRGNSSVCNFNSQISCECHCRIPEQLRRVRLQSNANMYQNIIHMDKAIKTLQDESEDGKAIVHFSHKVKRAHQYKLVFTQGSFANGAPTLGRGHLCRHQNAFLPSTQSSTFYQAPTEPTGRNMCPTQVLLANKEAQ